MRESMNMETEDRYGVNRPLGSSPAKNVGLVLNTIVHMMTAIVIYCVWRFAFQLGDINRFQLHFMFSATGYQLLMLEGALALHPYSSWSGRMDRDTRRLAHLVLQGLGSICTITGGSIAISLMKPHFSSAHGICGLIAMIFSILTPLGGLVVYLAPSLKYTQPLLVKTFHAISGCITLTMGMVTLAIGVNKKVFIFTPGNGESVSICMTVFIALTLAYALVVPLNKAFNHIKNMKTTVL